MIDKAEFDRQQREYWPCGRIRSHAMLFEAMAIDLTTLETLLAREINVLREAGIERVTKPNPDIVGKP